MDFTYNETVAKPRIISRDPGDETCNPGKTWARLRSGMTIIHCKQRVIGMPVCAFVRACSINKRQHRYLMPHRWVSQRSHNPESRDRDKRPNLSEEISF